MTTEREKCLKFRTFSIPKICFFFPDKSDDILERIVKVLRSKQNAIASGENTSSGVDEEILNTTEERISQHSDIISNATGTSDQHTHDLDTVDSLKDADINTSCSMSFSSVENEDTLMAELKVSLIFFTYSNQFINTVGR